MFVCLPCTDPNRESQSTFDCASWNCHRDLHFALTLLHRANPVDQANINVMNCARLLECVNFYLIGYEVRHKPVCRYNAWYEIKKPWIKHERHKLQTINNEFRWQKLMQLFNTWRQNMSLQGCKVVKRLAKDRMSCNWVMFLTRLSNI